MLADKPTREVFNITTGSDQVFPEVQSVTVSYDDVDEVQTITTRQVCRPKLTLNKPLPSVETECDWVEQELSPAILNKSAVKRASLQDSTLSLCITRQF